ncbi:MAG: hypothetical protein IPL47_16580 [Phyllobacteriaceae bacterium]|nr:hypothetical protein [Phyllobacteriaceae bacterium]
MTLVDDKIIHTIYSCATGDSSWDDGLRAVMGLIDARCAGIVRHSIAPVGAEVIAGVDVDPRIQAAYVSRYVRQNPLINCLSAMPLGFLTTGSGVVDESFYFDSDFYNSWQKPAGYADNMAIMLARRNGEFVLLSLPRGFERGVYTPEDFDIVKPYISHLVRAFNIWLRLTVAQLKTGWVEEALDQIGKGLIILGEDRIILYANRNGEALINSGVGLERGEFRLRATRSDVREALDATLAEFEAGIADETGDYGFPLERDDGRPPVFLRVQPPLGRKPGQRSFGLPKAVAFLHVVDPLDGKVADTDSFARTYGLTAGEARFPRSAGAH